jgi:hypothetical protein
MQNGGRGPLVAHRVWYRACPKARLFGGDFLAHEDIGTLTAFDDRVVFSGRKRTREFPPIAALDVRLQEADFINRWIRIEFEDGSSAMFCSGLLLGWVGVLGGTTWLAHRLRRRMRNPEAVRGLDMWSILAGFLPVLLLLGLLALIIFT